MVVILNPKTSEEEVERLIKELESLNVTVDKSKGTECTILGLVGDTRNIDQWSIEAHECVQKVMKVQEPFKKANRMFHPENTVVNVCGRKIGGKKIAMIAGPCSVESEEQIKLVANEVKKYGGGFLRGGAFKPRTSPYSFQGLKYEGLDLLNKAKEETGLPIVTEIMSPCDISKFIESTDIIQVGARNMQNFSLLKMLGSCGKPVLLKRGLSATIRDFLMAAEYLMAYGNKDIILCERGIRTFETMTRNTVDINAIPLIKEKSHLPIIIDASHGTGRRSLVKPVTLAGIMAGADGAMVEVHENPECAVSDGVQSLDFKGFAKLTDDLKEVLKLRKKLK